MPMVNDSSPSPQATPAVDVDAAPRKMCLYLPSLAGGGAERVFVQLANDFSARGLHVDMVLASARGPYLEDLSPGVRVVDFAAPGVLRTLPKLIRYLREERPDALLSGLDHANIVTATACKFAGTRTRCTISMRSVPTAVYRESPSIRGWLMLRLMWLTYRFADAIIANSNAVAQDVAALLGVSRDRIQVIFNPVDLRAVQSMSQCPVEHGWNHADATPIVLAVGRLDALKDFPTLIDAFAIVRARTPCRLVILGEGPDRSALEQRLRDRDLQDDVRLPGFVQNPFSWMRLSAVLVSSSVTEGCPNALLQGLACNTPIVSTDCEGGSAEILENGRWGRMVPVRDAAGMAEAIVAALNAPQHPDGPTRAREFSHEHVAEKYLRVLLTGRAPETAGI